MTKTPGGAGTNMHITCYACLYNQNRGSGAPGPNMPTQCDYARHIQPPSLSILNSDDTACVLEYTHKSEV